MKPGEVACAFCGEAVYANAADTFHEVSGWVQPRRTGGVHQVALRRTLGRWAHAECVRLGRARNRDVQQGLFGMKETHT